MIHSLKVALDFLKVSDKYHDIEGVPVDEKSLKIDRSGAIRYLKDLYPWMDIKTEPMEGGLAYYAELSSGRRMIGNYSFSKKELWYKVYPGTKIKRK